MLPRRAANCRPPHINVLILMRGMLKQLNSRSTFPPTPPTRKTPILQSVPEARRATLIAKAAGAAALEWNVVLQGAGETVFFDC